MIVSKDTNPEKDLYYMGAQVLEALAATDTNEVDYVDIFLSSDHSAPFSGQILKHVFSTPRSGVLGILVFEFHLQSKTSPPGNPVEPSFRTTLQKTTNRGLQFPLSHVQIGKFQMVATLTNFTVMPPE